MNPHTQEGLLPVFPGAYTLARMSHRPIRIMALHGLDRFWHGDESILDQKVTGRNVEARAYPPGTEFESGEEFVETFKAIAGTFGASGQDLPKEELTKWLDGTAWKEKAIHSHEEGR